MVAFGRATQGRRLRDRKGRSVREGQPRRYGSCQRDAPRRQALIMFVFFFLFFTQCERCRHSYFLSSLFVLQEQLSPGRDSRSPYAWVLYRREPWSLLMLALVFFILIFYLFNFFLQLTLLGLPYFVFTFPRLLSLSIVTII